MSDIILAEKQLDNGRRAIIILDQIPNDPLDTDDCVKLYFWSGAYSLGSKNDFDSPHDFIGGDDLLEDHEVGEDIPFHERWQRARKQGVVPPASGAIIPLVATDHGSGEWRVRLAEYDESIGEAFDRWSVNNAFVRQVVGFGYVRPEDVEANFKGDDAKALEAIRISAQVYENYLNGSVYAYVDEQVVSATYTNPVTGTEESIEHTVHIDSCFGFHIAADNYWKMREELAPLIDEHLGEPYANVEWDWK